MKKCIEKLKVVEANRAAVVSELKEALQEQVGTTWSLTSYDAFSFFPWICICLSSLLVFWVQRYEILLVYVNQESELEKVRTQLQVMFPQTMEMSLQACNVL